MSDDIAVRPLAEDDAVERFDCGVDELNSWLRRHALANARLDSTRTHVAIVGDGALAGYVALTAAGVAHSDSPGAMTAGMPRYPIPVVLLARLATDRGHQRQGVASALMRHAMELTVETAEAIGVRGLAVDAIDDDVARFYERFGFDRAAPGSLKLAIPTAQLRTHLQQ